MVGGLVFAVYTLSSILTTPATSNLGGPSANSITSFDNETIKRLNDLHPSDENTSTQSTTSGRVSPFSE